MITNDHDDYQEPESDGSLEFWQWCEEQMDLEEQSDICPKCGKQGGEYTPTLDECAFC